MRTRALTSRIESVWVVLPAPSPPGARLVLPLTTGCRTASPRNRGRYRCLAGAESGLAALLRRYAYPSILPRRNGCWTRNRMHSSALISVSSDPILPLAAGARAPRRCRGPPPGCRCTWRPMLPRGGGWAPRNRLSSVAAARLVTLAGLTGSPVRSPLSPGILAALVVGTSDLLAAAETAPMITDCPSTLPTT